MTQVLARLAQGRDIGFGDFADITDAAVVGIDWVDGLLCVTFDGDLTAAEVQLVRLRITSSDATEEALRVAAATFLTNQSPTLADAVAQLRRLTRLVLTIDN